MSKLNEIKEGYTNLFKAGLGTAKDTTETMAELRYAQCKTCPFFNIASTCTKCGCYMPAKVRVNNAKCPAGKW